VGSHGHGLWFPSAQGHRASMLHNVCVCNTNRQSVSCPAITGRPAAVVSQARLPGRSDRACRRVTPTWVSCGLNELGFANSER
jgi:hypothetical protein